MGRISQGALYSETADVPILPLAALHFLTAQFPFWFLPLRK